MIERKALRSLTALGLAAAAVAAPTTPAAAEDAPCTTLCMVATAGSGYVGEDAIWYYAGCVYGCTIASKLP